MNDKEKEAQGQTTDEELDFFKDVLDDPDAEEDQPDSSEGDEVEVETEEQKKEKERSQKNKDAEEARKRREAEEKAKKALEEKKAKEEAEKKAKEDAESKKQEAKDKQVESLGKQLDDFKKDFPDIDLKELDNDKAFKKFIDGKLLGKKNFTELYKDYLEVKADLTGKSKEDIEANYQKKAGASSGSSQSKTTPNPDDVYSQEEYDKLVARLPFMTDSEARAVEAKFDRSTKYYSKK